MPSLIFHPVQLFKRFASSIAYLPTLAALCYGTLGLLALIPPVSSDFLPDTIKGLGLEEPSNAQLLLAVLLQECHRLNLPDRLSKRFPS